MSTISMEEQHEARQDKAATISGTWQSAKVAYIMSYFPELTETFILYEILEMVRLGVAVEIYPLMRGHEGVVHAEVETLVERAHFQPLLSWPIIRAQWHFIRRRPRAYFQVLADVLKGTFGNANFFLGALVFFPKSVCFAYEMIGQGITHMHAQFATHATVAALIINRLTDIPFSFTARGSDIHVDRRMLKEKLEAAAFAITVSNYNKEVMVEECGFSARDKIHVVYGGVNTETFRPTLKSESNGRLQILCVARFEEVKGHTILIEACRLLQERGVEFECHLVGDGELRPDIEKQVAQAELGEQMRLWGYCPQNEVLEKMAQADVVVLATVPASNGKREGIPNALKEAMACGLPVVGSEISGIPELVEHGRSGILVPPGDAGALADALQELKEDPALRGRMGRAGREKIERVFNLRTSTAIRARLFANTENHEGSIG
jgi:glycosyltransferase involved in cell wall biosynthesis